MIRYRLQRLGLLVGILCLPMASLLGEPAPAAPPLAPAAADLELMDQILIESRVQTRTPRISMNHYLGHLFQSFQKAVIDLLARASNRLSNIDQILLWIGRLLVGSALLVLVLGIAGFVRKKYSQRTPRRRFEAKRKVVSSNSEPWGADAWRREIEQRLAKGSIQEALEAVWWWVARHLMGSQADPTWTSGELTLRAQRPELAPALRQLDSMIYGSSLPPASRVENLVADLEAQVS